MLGSGALLHRAVEAGRGVVVEIVREHGPELSGVFVGDSDDDLAEGHATGERLDPDLLGGGLVQADPFGAFKT